ncbi:MAG: hypothetical protein JW807_07445 [Spirochaetes bacterium]|nr:hypothetical protein [Spirochaetota bacterium]
MLLCAVAFVLWLCAAYKATAAEPPKIKAVVKPDKATVGSILDYRVNVAGMNIGTIEIVPPEKRECYPEPKKEEQAKKKSDRGEDAEEDPAHYVPLYIIHSVKKDDRSDKSMTDITVSMQLSFYRPGTWALPDIEIRGADGIAIGYKVPTVEILAVNEKGEYQEIEPPLSLGGNYWRLAFLAMGLIALGVAAFFAYRYIRRVWEERRAAPIVIPPIETFMSDLEKFNGDRLIDEGKIEEFVFGISMIFRKFLSSQFGFDATDMTTYEIERKIMKVFPRSLYDRHAGDIVQGLNLWDLSKFAEFTPSGDMLRASLAKTIELAKNLSGEADDGAPRV